MTRLRRLPYCWRVSRYSPELRVAGAQWESWIDVSQVGQTYNGLPLTSEEYQRVEDAYVHAAFQFALDTSTQVFRIAYLGHQEDGYALSPDQTLLRFDLGPVVRGNLRGSLDCGLEGTDYGCQILSVLTFICMLRLLDRARRQSTELSEAACSLSRVSAHPNGNKSSAIVRLDTPGINGSMSPRAGRFGVSEAAPVLHLDRTRRRTSLAAAACDVPPKSRRLPRSLLA